MRTVLLSLAALVFLVGCDSSNPFATDQSVTLDVSRLDAPATVANGTPIAVVLTVTTGGCVSFDHIEVNRDLGGAQVTVWGHDAAKGRKGIACTANIVFEPHSYQFDPPFANSFTIQVDRGRMAPLQTTVQIQ